MWILNGQLFLSKQTGVPEVLVTLSPCAPTVGGTSPPFCCLSCKCPSCADSHCPEPALRPHLTKALVSWKFISGPGFWMLCFANWAFRSLTPQRTSLRGSHFYMKPRMGTWGFWYTWKVENRWCRQTSWSLHSHPQEHLASAPGCGPSCSALSDISLGLVPWTKSQSALVDEINQGYLKTQPWLCNLLMWPLLVDFTLVSLPAPQPSICTSKAHICSLYSSVLFPTLVCLTMFKSQSLSLGPSACPSLGLILSPVSNPSTSFKYVLTMSNRPSGPSLLTSKCWLKFLPTGLTEPPAQPIHSRPPPCSPLLTSDLTPRIKYIVTVLGCPNTM